MEITFSSTLNTNPDDIEVVNPIVLINGKPCTHSDKSIVVVEAYATCEVTKLQCDYCGLILKKNIQC